MRRLFTYLSFIFLLNISAQAFGQLRTDTLTMRFMDVEIPLRNVVVYLRNGIVLAHSDSGGYIHIPAYYLQYTYLIAVHDNYLPDTIRQYQETIYLYPINITLKETVISSKTTQRILQSNAEYVVDYDFVGDNILVASYNGAFGRNAKLFLLDNDGDTLALTKLPSQPLSLFKSCVGKYYCVCYGKFYPLTVDSGNLQLGEPYDIKYLPGLKQCQAELNGNLFYKICDPDSFLVTYAYVEKGDSVFHTFFQFHDSLAFIGSREEDIYATEDEHRMFRPKFEVGLLRGLWDKSSLRAIDVPLFIKDDTLVIFDHTNKMVRYFNLIGIEVKRSPCHFLDNKNLYADIIKDGFTEKFYLHPLNHGETQILNEILMKEGILDYHTLKMKRPFAENIKVHNGHIYFLWQDHNHAGTRQLFVYTP